MDSKVSDVIFDGGLLGLGNFLVYVGVNLQPVGTTTLILLNIGVKQYSPTKFNKMCIVAVKPLLHLINNYPGLAKLCQI